METPVKPTTHYIPAKGLAGLKENWQSDLLSGFLVSLIALPLSLGIASASNFPPIMGVLTAIVGGLVVAFFAGSEPTIKGPAAGLIVIVAGCVEELGRGDNELGWKLALGVIVAAGFLQVIMGLLKVAKLADFFPLSAVHGMLAAIGIIIMSKQLHLAVGIAPSEMKGKEPLELIAMVPESLAHMEWHVAIIGIISLIILFSWPSIKSAAVKRIPPALVVLVVAVALGFYFHLSDTRQYGSIKPLVNPGEFKLAINVGFGAWAGDLLPIALKYLAMFTLIGSLESLLTGKAIDLLDPYKRKSNLSKDLTAVGIGNMVSAVLGGIPMISEVARSSANLTNGGKTRWANFFHGAFLLVFVVALVPLIKLVPVAALAAILIAVGFRLANPKEFRHMYAIGPEQLIVFVITIIATLATDLLIGIAVGILTEFIIQVVLGLPLKYLFNPDQTLVSNGNHHKLTINGAAVFTNYLSIKKQLDIIPQEAGQYVTVDLHRAHYVDHTVMENLHNYERDFQLAGGEFHVINLDEHKPMSAHPLAARRKKMAI
ncbi:SulP family inorganic anion transporter [Spirosoma sp. HMF3257]|uniref:SulP family inorganic anion transporter n=1 Tax=Spirosoma telluris TaxID=2183553 RepID=A0A327NQ88_9BACT|nr:SulP family inorganic anion transporter [Spirosoma telluris]RAI76176.1 SulP family inorganic anion transporter [Spirosoma telluris]